MQHSIHRVTGCEQTAPYTLRVRFEDGVSRTINFEPILRGELFGPLRDPEEFARVSIDPEVRALVWPSGADFDPTILYDWPEHEPAFKKGGARGEACCAKQSSYACEVVAPEAI